jgi:hypothetical protein
MGFDKLEFDKKGLHDSFRLTSPEEEEEETHAF